MYRRINSLPLGTPTAFGTGNSLTGGWWPIIWLFEVLENSLDAISDRDYLIEFTAAASLIGLHVSQMGSELLLWSSREFGFFRLPRGFVFRGQSLPQRPNAELLEILRSRPANIFGRLSQFLTELKGLPLSYCQDLQESLPGLLEIGQSLNLILELSTVLLPAFKFDTNCMKESASSDQTNAANAIDYLIDRGVEPKRASETVNHIIAYCKERRRIWLISQSTNGRCFRRLSITPFMILSLSRTRLIIAARNSHLVESVVEPDRGKSVFQSS